MHQLLLPPVVELRWSLRPLGHLEMGLLCPHLSGVFLVTYFCGDIQSGVKEMEVGKEENKSGKEQIGLTGAVGKPEGRKGKI